MRINKYLATCGIASRRKAEELIKSGKVLVNNKIVTELSTQINPNDIVKVNGKIVKPENNFVYIMLNKPKGYLCSSVNEGDKPSVLKLIKTKERLFTVGRLDFNTEGLLLLTNDGEFANSVTHPKNQIKKTYEVIVNGKPNELQLEKLKKPFNIDGYTTTPAIISKIKRNSENTYSLNVTIFEGRNRQIRKMFELVNLKILSLKRIQIGQLKLNDLPPGSYVYLTEQEIKKIFN